MIFTWQCRERAESLIVTMFRAISHLYTFDYYNNRTDVAVKPVDFNVFGEKPESRAEGIQSYVNGHDRVWLFAQPRGSEDVLNLTVNTLNKSYAISYKERYETSIFYDIYDVYLFKRIT
jgi:hypothetical protein